MSGENLTPELARLIRRLEARIHALEAKVAPVGARSLNDLDDVYINVLARSDGDVVTWVEANQDWEALSGGGGGLPTDWVEYEVDSPPQGPYAYSVSARTVDWVDGSFSHGGAIVLNAGQPEVTEDGWYTLDTYVLVEATTIGSVWTRALGILLVNRSFAIGGDSQDNVFLSQVFGPYVDNDGRWGGNASFSWTGYLMAGDSVTVKGLLAADVAPGDTWVIAEAQFRMEKLPM